MSQVRIYQPTKTAMQSGRSRLGLWILEYEPVSAKLADPLMGWINYDSLPRDGPGGLWRRHRPSGAAGARGSRRRTSPPSRAGRTGQAVP